MSEPPTSHSQIVPPLKNSREAEPPPSTNTLGSVTTIVGETVLHGLKDSLENLGAQATSLHALQEKSGFTSPVPYPTPSATRQVVKILDDALEVHAGSHSPRKGFPAYTRDRQFLNSAYRFSAPSRRHQPNF